MAKKQYFEIYCNNKKLETFIYNCQNAGILIVAESKPEIKLKPCIADIYKSVSK